MKNKISLKTLHIILMILGTIFISLSIFHTTLWFDESYSVGIANQSFIDIWKIGGHDVHPVLYYWMLRVVNILTGGSILAYRIFSALAIAVLGLLGYTHIRKDFGEKTGLLFSFFSYFLPMMAVYANQIRMYSWAIVFVTLLSIYAYRIYNGDTSIKNWIIFFLTSLASLYIHYYGLMAAGLINLFLFISFIKNKKFKELKCIVILGIIQAIAYVPWLMYLISQISHVSKGFWIGFEFPDTIFELIGCQMNGTRNSTGILAIGFTVNVLLFIYLAIVFVKTKNKNDYKAVKFATLVYASVFLAAFLLRYLVKTNILYYRYLFVITGLYIFVLSDILAKSKNKYILGLIITITIVLGTANNIIQIQDNYAKGNIDEIKYLQANIQKDDVIVYSNIGNGSIIASNFLDNKQYFYNGADWGVEEAYKCWAPQMETWITTDFLQYCTGRVWIIDSQDNGFYDELFNNDDFKFISTKTFEQKYQNYIYNITLVERVQ